MMSAVDLIPRRPRSPAEFADLLRACPPYLQIFLSRRGYAIRRLRYQLGLPKPRRQWTTVEPHRDEWNETKRIAAAQAVWRNARPGRGTAAEMYFDRRGLSVPDDVWPLVRFTPVCRFRGERVPHAAIILPFTNSATGQLTAVHKIAAYPNGWPVRKPDRSKLKISSGLVKGAAIIVRPLAKTATELCLCKGFETALGIVMGSWRGPLLALSGASFLAKCEPVLHVRHLVIGADNDRNGTGVRAAVECVQRWAGAGSFVEITWPHKLGGDFADMPRGPRFLG